ncbi:guanylate-binding protein 4-like [Dama dama]
MDLRAECAKKDAAKREQELLREKQNEEKQKLEAQERSFKENLAQLQEKMDRERENLQREQEMMLEHKLKMQKEILTEGFKKEVEELTKEVNTSYVTELTELIRIKSSPISHRNDVEDSVEFLTYFQDFVWTVWNFMLELELDGNPITENEYLENVLKLIPGLGTLVEAYVDAINSGGAPCLENAVITLAECENSSVMQKAADHYSEQMTPRLSLPTDTLQELLEVHAACEREAIAIFLRDSFKDDKQMFQKKLAKNEPRDRKQRWRRNC